MKLILSLKRFICTAPLLPSLVLLTKITVSHFTYNHFILEVSHLARIFPCCITICPKIYTKIRPETRMSGRSLEIRGITRVWREKAPCLIKRIAYVNNSFDIWQSIYIFEGRVISYTSIAG